MGAAADRRLDGRVPGQPLAGMEIDTQQTAVHRAEHFRQTERGHGSEGAKPLVFMSRKKGMATVLDERHSQFRTQACDLPRAGLALPEVVNEQHGSGLGPKSSFEFGLISAQVRPNGKEIDGQAGIQCRLYFYAAME